MRHPFRARLSALLFTAALLAGFCVSYAAPAAQSVHVPVWRGSVYVNSAVAAILDEEDNMQELFAACHRYFKKTGRRISFEYAMIDGVNDHDWQADLLAERIRGMPGHVNLIPLNDVVESEFKPSRRVAAFQKRLESHGLTATVRRSLGGDIDAS